MKLISPLDPLEELAQPPVAKMRICLHCGQEFMSPAPGVRCCSVCKGEAVQNKKAIIEREYGAGNV